MRTGRFGVPRWMALIQAFVVWLIVIPIAHGILPWVISSHTRRYGWAGGRPSPSNMLGLMLIAAAIALLIWILVVAIAQIPHRVELGLTPSSLMMRGPYAVTRNPMYIAELGLWLGWALLFGSLGVLSAFAVLCMVVTLIIVPWEERGLETRFGQYYLEYKNSVPRWFGKTHG